MDSKQIDYSFYPSVAVIEGRLVDDKFLATSEYLRNRFAQADERIARTYQSLSIAQSAVADLKYYGSFRYVTDTIQARIASWWDATWPRLLFAGLCLVPVTVAIISLASKF